MGLTSKSTTGNRGLIEWGQGYFMDLDNIGGLGFRMRGLPLNLDASSFSLRRL